MKPFDVNEPHFNFLRPLLLEASAGTGKTHSIENSVVRVLLEGDLSIRDILVVTFTKAAARDLKKRIKQCLHQKLKELDGEGMRRKIRQALLEFDQAWISTIHSFCYRALQEHSFSDQGVMDPEKLPEELVWEVVERYFRTSISEANYSPAQINILLKRHGYSVTKLALAIVNKTKTGIAFGKGLSNAEGLKLLLKVIPEGLLGLVEEHASSYYKMTVGRTGVLKPDLRKVFQRMEALEDWDSFLEEGVKAVQLLSKENQIKKADVPDEVQGIFDSLMVIRELGSYESLFVRLASECQREIFQAFEAKGVSDFNYLLLKMQQMVDDPLFQQNLRASFRWVVIDEFQDTDPVQWNIFNTLFFKGGIPVLLVGDPKQSIYAFRSADIYTYMQAKDSIPPDSHYVLDTNWRSSARLISALNHFFSSEHVPGWMPLPYLQKELSYHPVLAPSVAKKKDTSEPPLQFLVAEGDNLEELERSHFFPRFFEEVQKLQEEKIPLSQIAFLVRDHAQSDRLYRYFLSRALPAFQQRGVSLNQSKVLPDLIHLLQAWLAPRNMGLLQAALGTCFFKWSLEEMEELVSFEKLVEVAAQFNRWGRTWRSKGIGEALQEFLPRSIPMEKESYHELRQLLEWIAVKEAEERLSPEACLKELQSVFDVEFAAQDANALRPLTEKEAVPIMTIHMSKGLEFEAVFALGVVSRPPVDEGIIPVREEGRIVLKSVFKDDPAYEAYLAENDAEKARQLYVALTRAKSRLYIPVVEGLKKGSASPLELHLDKIRDPLTLQKLVDMCSDCRLERLQPNPASSYFKKASLEPILEEPKEVKVDAPLKYAVSFTGLFKKKGTLPHCPPASSILPLGATTGELVHKIMEEIPFSLVREVEDPLDLHPFICKYISGTSFEVWQGELAELVFNAFKTKVEPLGVSLDQIEEGGSFREMEFMFPLKCAQEIPECTSIDGVVKGVIDLFFMHADRYYILDWKTNWLGDDYSDEALKKAMLDHGYDLQAALYRLAVKQYLAKTDSRPFEQIFGGTLYYFMRGNAVHYLPEELNAVV